MNNYGNILFSYDLACYLARDGIKSSPRKRDFQYKERKTVKPTKQPDDEQPESEHKKIYEDQAIVQDSDKECSAGFCLGIGMSIYRALVGESSTKKKDDNYLVMLEWGVEFCLLCKITLQVFILEVHGRCI